jgi:hypothetical protein
VTLKFWNFGFKLIFNCTFKKKYKFFFANGLLAKNWGFLHFLHIFWYKMKRNNFLDPLHSPDHILSYTRKKFKISRKPLTFKLRSLHCLLASVLHFQISVQSRAYLVIWRASGSKSQNPNRPLKIYSLKKVSKEFLIRFQVAFFEDALNYLINFYKVEW